MGGTSLQIYVSFLGRVKAVDLMVAQIAEAAESFLHQEALEN